MPAADMAIAAYRRAFKTFFLPGEIERINYAKNPYLAMISKVPNFKGFDMKYAASFEDPGGVSNSFAEAQANKTPSQYIAFQPTTKKLYGIASIQNETLRASQDQLGAFINSKIEETQGLMRSCSRRLASQLFRNGGGAIGKRGSLAGNVLTLTNPEDVVFFWKNMKLVASTGDGSSAGHTLRGGIPAVVDSVNRNQGTVTSTSWANITGFADADFLFPEGDFKLGFAGKAGWIPATDPVGGDNWMGQDRSEDPVRAAGVRFDANSKPAATGLSMVAKFMKGNARLMREGGGAADTIWINNDRYAELEIELEGRKQIVEVKSAHAGIGFEAISMSAGGARIKIMADHNCQDEIAWMDRDDTWKLCSRGPLPGFLTDEQLIIEPANDGFEIRVGGYGEQINKAPGYNGRIDLDV